jgi:hypothetical protein
MSPVCNIMIVPCNQLVGMVIVDDATNNYEAFTLQSLSSEYNRILRTTEYSILHEYSQMYTNWDDNRLSCHQYAI